MGLEKDEEDIRIILAGNFRVFYVNDLFFF